MKNAKRIVTGLAFTAALALSLLASGGEADARTKTGGRLPVTAPAPAAAAPAVVHTLGVTWE